MRLSTFFTALKTQALVVGATMVVGAAGIGMAMTGSPNPAVWGSRLMGDLTSGPGGGHGAQNGIIVADPSPAARPSPEPSESPSVEPTQKPETSSEGTAPSGGELDTEHSPTPYPTQTPEPVPSHSPSDEGGSGGE